MGVLVEVAVRVRVAVPDGVVALVGDGVAVGEAVAVEEGVTEAEAVVVGVGVAVGVGVWVAATGGNTRRGGGRAPSASHTSRLEWNCLDTRPPCTSILGGIFENLRGGGLHLGGQTFCEWPE